jgi:hypothetical protein
MAPVRGNATPIADRLSGNSDGSRQRPKATSRFDRFRDRFVSHTDTLDMKIPSVNHQLHVASLLASCHPAARYKDRT